MPEYTLPHFGTLQLESLEEYYQVDLELNGKAVQVDLNFEANTLDVETFQRVKSFIENIEKFDQKIKIIFNKILKMKRKGLLKNMWIFILKN